MAKKKNQNKNNENGNGCGGGEKQKPCAVTMVVLKMDLHCEGCTSRVVKTVRTLDGVESVTIGDIEANKITVIGNVDPVKLQQKVEEKTKKKVELDSDNTAHSGGGGDNKKQPPHEKTPVMTAVLKVPLHCQGCIRRIHKLVSKTKGYMEMSIDKNKDLVRVKGRMDMKLLVEALQHKLKRGVEIVPQKKDGGDGGGVRKGEGNDGEGKGEGGEKKGKDGGEDERNDGGEKKGKGNDGERKGGEKKGKGGGEDEGNDGGGKAEAYKMEIPHACTPM